ncbi:MAG: tetratricopeptide repeat protein [Leptospira sp.]|nr:tetratricopeptide repeat protein [Leptospira sp.]
MSNKQTYETYYLLAHDYWKTGDYKAAIDHFYNALKIKPDDEAVLLDLIKIHASVNRLRGAFELCYGGMKKNPGSRELKLAYASLLVKVKRPMKALEVIENLKSERADDFRPLSVESMIYYELGNLEKSETSIKWALAIAPENAALLNNLALIYEKSGIIEFKSGKKDSAKKKFEEAKIQIDSAAKRNSGSAYLENQKRITERLNAI